MRKCLKYSGAVQKQFIIFLRYVVSRYLQSVLMRRGTVSRGGCEGKGQRRAGQRGGGGRGADGEEELCIIKAGLNKIFMQIHLPGLKLCCRVGMVENIP